MVSQHRCLFLYVFPRSFVIKGRKSWHLQFGNITEGKYFVS